MKNTFKKAVLALTLLTATTATFAPVMGQQASAASTTASWAKKADATIADGRKYMGRKYVFGASTKTTRVFDCSSFTKRIYAENGITLPRKSIDQAKVGKFVKRSDLRKGDLVFFSTSHSHGKIGHVGVYMGNGKFIHSYPSKGVAISDLNSKWWGSHYITARRVIN